jgi:F0F1-type ATP synthase assembly protein I
LIFTFFGAFTTAIAIFLGGSSGCFVNAVFMYVCFLVPGLAQKNKQIVITFYIAEALKLLLTTLIFSLGVFFYKISFIPMLIAFLATYASFSWLGLFFVGESSN